MREWTDEKWDDYIREVNAAYWAEEAEIQIGIHPTQNSVMDFRNAEDIF